MSQENVGLVRGLLDWMAPWNTYRIETEKAIDLGERVLPLNRRIDAYTTRADALEAVGLSE